jgi:transcriptional regulator with XRE-family HTH domain
MSESGQRTELNADLLRTLIHQKRAKDELTLRDAASICGIGFSTLSRFERGYSGKPDLETLERLANWLDVSVQALFGKPKPVEAHLRAQKNLDSVTANALRDLIVAAREHFLDKQPLPDADETDETLHHELIPREQWERTADEIRKSLGFNSEERIDPFKLPIPGVAHAGARDIPGVPNEVTRQLLVEGSRCWSAATIPLGSQDTEWLILINSSHSPERQRSSLMEEYCHVLLGHEMSRLTFQEGLTFRDYLQGQEEEAYSIGAAILLPQSAVRKCLMNQDSAEKMGKHFGVSRELVEYRIKRLRLWFLYRLQRRERHSRV